MKAVASTLAYIVEQINLGKRPDEIITQEAAFDKGSFHHIRYIRKPYSDLFVLRQMDEIKNLAEVNLLLDLMQESEVVRSHYKGKVEITEGSGPKTNSDLRPIIFNDLYVVFLRKYAQSEYFPRFSQESFDSLYSGMDAYLYGDYEWRYFAPLPQFSMSSDKLELQNGITIRRITESEFNRALGWGLMPEFSLAGLIPPQEILMSPFVIETFCKQSDFRELESRIASVIDALRLFKPGGAGISGIFRKEELDWGMNFSASIPPDRRVHLLTGHYRLDESEVPTFKIFYDNYSRLLPKISELRFIDVAIRRFVVAIEEILPEDRIIDSMIALEGLFSKETQEISYRLSHRISSLLGNNDDERAYLFEFVKKAYDARSRLVHGDVLDQVEVQGKLLTVYELATELERITRLSMRKFLNLIDHYGGKKAIIHDLDNSVIKASLRDLIKKRASGSFD